MKISLFGLGYVGAVSTACLAHLGHEVIGVDVHPEKVKAVRRGSSPIVEPRVTELLEAGVAAGRIHATEDATSAVLETEISIVCVGTPSGRDGSVQTVHLSHVVAQIADACRAKQSYHLLLVRSTALPAVHEDQVGRIRALGLRTDIDLGYVVHPEFLREGSAVADFLAPPKIVFGGADARAQAILSDLYPGLAAPVFFTSRNVAALVKYADNAFHAAKITFSNEIGRLCKSVGADSHAVMDIFCSDKLLNISTVYLKPGLPFGGSCLPKDLRALTRHAAQSGIDTPLLAAISGSNQRQLEDLAADIIALGGRRYLLIGLSFKAATDDVRESPMMALAERLLGKGLLLNIFEPNLAPERLVGANRSYALEAIPHLAELLNADLPAAAAAADVIVVGSHLTVEQRALLESTQATLVDLVRAWPSPPGNVRRYLGLYW